MVILQIVQKRLLPLAEMQKIIFASDGKPYDPKYSQAIRMIALRK